jgi:hypothetical protein
MPHLYDVEGAWWRGGQFWIDAIYDRCILSSTDIVQGKGELASKLKNFTPSLFLL